MRSVQIWKYIPDNVTILKSFINSTVLLRTSNKGNFTQQSIMAYKLKIIIRLLFTYE